jgi:hypothetical protein
VGAAVLIFIILGDTPLVLIAALAGMLYLTWLELRQETLEPLVQLWWYLLVLLFNVIGYAALRIWLAIRRRRAAERRPA